MGINVVMLLIVFFALGLLVGMLKERQKIKSMGYLRIDPDGPFLFLELAVPTEKLMKRKYATFEIADLFSNLDPQD